MIGLLFGACCLTVCLRANCSLGAGLFRVLDMVFMLIVLAFLVSFGIWFYLMRLLVVRLI